MSAAEFSRRTLLGGIVATPVALRAAGDKPIETAAGRFQGRTEQGVRAFRGIRYGRAARFQAPVAEPPARTLVIADRFGPSAPQRGSIAPQSEGCLFLNIWAPAPDGAGRPVLVYLHGGAYSTGTVAEPRVEGAALAARDCVVVTVNHRLNALGYLGLPGFPDAANAGQMDLVLALQWVQANIAPFGGDPANVTLFGQSGGGAKIITLMSMPSARGLFRRGWTMSGQQVTVQGPQNAARRAQAYLARLGGDPTSLPVEKLVAALGAEDPVLGGALYFGPTLDMGSVPRHPFFPAADPGALGLPLVLGNTISETRAFFPPDRGKRQGLSWANLAERLGPELRVDIDPGWVIAQYRDRYPAISADRLFIRATTAARSWRGQLIEAEERDKAGAPAFVYQLDWRDAAHMDDIPLVFGTTADKADFPVRDAMMDALLRFARTGNPGWSPYRLPRRTTMLFGAGNGVADDPRAFERELFARVPYVQPGS